MKKSRKKTAVSAGNTAETKSNLTNKQQEIMDRRDKVQRMLLRGYTNSQVAAMFNVGLRTIEHDISEMRKTFNDEHAANKARTQDSIIGEKLEELRQLKSEFWTLRSESKTDPSKVSSLQGVLATIEREQKLMEKAGLLPRDSLDPEFKQPVNVYFSIARPDRTAQLAKINELRESNKT